MRANVESLDRQFLSLTIPSVTTAPAGGKDIKLWCFNDGSATGSLGDHGADIMAIKVGGTFERHNPTPRWKSVAGNGGALLLPACDTAAMASMNELADRLQRGAETMVEMGPAIAAGEPWPLADDVGPSPESSWGPREVLAHVAEMLPYWQGEIELILDAGGGMEPPGFGRLEADGARIAIIDRDRHFPARELLGRIEVEAQRVSRRFRAFTDADAATLGRHVTRGDLSIAEIAERLMVGHLEGHVTQLREALAAR